MGSKHVDGSTTMLFFIGILLFIIALALAFFMSFKRGEKLTPNEKFTIHRTYWTFLAAFGFLFLAVVVGYSGTSSSGSSSKKSNKYDCGESDNKSKSNSNGYKSYDYSGSSGHETATSGYDNSAYDSE